MKKLEDLNVVIVHDWLYGGGAERVVYELHKIFPDAPIYTSYCTDEWRKKLDDKVVTGYLQHWPFSKLRRFIPFLRVRWFNSLDLSDYDLIISSAGNGEAKDVTKPKDAVHICYCHSPVHFYHRHYEKYLEKPGFGIFDPIARLGLKLLVGPLRRRDVEAAQKPDYFIANSSHIKRDVRKYYSRDSEVIYPPVDTERFDKVDLNGRRGGFVTVGRQVSHKRVDIIVAACTKLNLPLRVVGSGPENGRLRQIAGPSVEFVTDALDEDIPGILSGAEGFIFASYDDFGITPVEAMAAGTPVIAYKAGGALDYVVPGKTGEFFEEQSAESLMKALEQFDGTNYSHDDINKHSKQFSKTIFNKNLVIYIKNVIK